MAWFRNVYLCSRCGSGWTDEWSCMCDDDCPHCGARHISPTSSDDLSETSELRGSTLVLLRSHDTAEREPSYRDVAAFELK